MSRGGTGRPADEPESPERPLRSRWAASGVGTVLATIGFWLIVAGASEAAGDARFPLVVSGVASFFLAFMGLVAISRAARPLGATVRSFALGSVVFAALVVIGVITDSPITFAGAVVIALGVGGVAALARTSTAVIAPRLWAVAVVTVVTWGLLLVAPPIGVLATTVLPFNALVIADMWVDRTLV